MKKKQILAEVGLVYAAAIWGSTFYVVKDSLAFINPLLLVSYRFLLASLIFLIFLIIKKENIFKNFKYGIILGVLLGSLYMFQTVGLKYTTASNSGFITGLFVLFIPIFGYIIFKEIPTKFKIISAILATIGLWILTGGMNSINIGDMYTLVAAVAYCLHLLYSGKFMKNNISPYLMNFQQFLVVGLISLFLSKFYYNEMFTINISALKSIIFLAIFPTASAFIIQLKAQKFIDDFRVGVIFSLEPVFAAIFSWTLGGEIFTIKGFIGGSFIVTAMIISEMKIKNKIACEEG
ncbi:MAG: hypothetical protein PWP46_1793 [Fusobacteriaceae bacterium]|jgi:drug/metabolite transporter (DMT)-like permease|nr:hypothetical protein [Fusobacteriales bacterium]MDN5304907.1 hypothetical protein [Fusobacteriaceae bacterium]